MFSIWDRKQVSFGFVSTRFAGTDGVSLETRKWVEVLTAKGCRVCFFAGQLDTPEKVSFLAPKAFFNHPEILEIQEHLFVTKKRSREVSRHVEALKIELRQQLQQFYERFQFDILVVQNALAIPVNIPLGLAITEFVAETGIHTIAHHHDFFWERQRFHSFAAMDYMRAAFPPVHPKIQHVVINSLAGAELANRARVAWTLIPNIMDFKTMPAGVDEYTADFRRQIGLRRDDFMILQPTRLVSRKGIETSIELISRLKHPGSVLVIPHESGDEGHGYSRRVLDYAKFMGVKVNIIADRIAQQRQRDDNGRKCYTLWDVYPHADLVSYPSIYEGYGNAFVEAIYFRKPVVVNRYAIFEADIEPKGFQVIGINGYITDETIANLRTIISDRPALARMAEHNYMLGWRYLSYEMLEEKLEGLLANIFGS